MTMHSSNSSQIEAFGHDPATLKFRSGGSYDYGEVSALTFGSLFAGIGGFDLGFEQAGMKCLWQVEFDPKCRTVLANYFLGVERTVCDVRQAGKANLKAVDVICGGSPCQGFSVAGLRGSMNDDRSNLCLQYVRICNELDPSIIVWENVPGVLNTPDNAFGCFLSGLVGADAPLVPAAGQRWTNAGLAIGPKRAAAWRVLDSQYFGVAQRRERVFVVASPRKELPAQILLVEPGVRRNTPPSREARQDAAAATGSGAAGGGEWGGYDISPALSASGRGTERAGESRGQDCVIPDICSTLLGGANETGGTRHNYDSLIPVVARSINAGRDGYNDGSDQTYIPDITLAVNPGSGQRMNHTHETMVVLPILEAGARTGKSASDPRAGMGVGEAGDPMFTLQSGHQHAVAFQPRIGRNGRGQPSQAVPALNGADAGATSDMRPCVAGAFGVRRLTPVECERLHGFPDGWTESQSDSARYKQLGNAVTVNVALWLAKKVNARLINRRLPT